jgi:hypothetical protein
VDAPPAPKPAPAQAEAPKPDAPADTKQGAPVDLSAAAKYGVIGLLNATGGDPGAPTAPWGQLDDDASQARGGMFGNAAGEAFGVGGLGLAGVGEGGRGQGIGLGSIGTLGRGAGSRRSVPKIRAEAMSVSGRLFPEVIQRIVRQNFGRFRLCYESGLRADPLLQGRVSIRFIIAKDGRVSSTSNAGSDLPSTAVVACVARAFQGLAFPAPDGGIVTVTYPLVFSPGDPVPPPSGTSPIKVPSTAPLSVDQKPAGAGKKP